MATVSLSGADTVQIDDRILGDLATQDPATLEYPNDMATVKQGKNGNVIYALNNMGFLAELKLRVLLGGADDKFLNSRMIEERASFSDFILLTGVFTKRVGDGKGGINQVVYQCSGGVIKRQPNAKTSAEGDAEQSVVEYTVTFGDASRSIQ